MMRTALLAASLLLAAPAALAQSKQSAGLVDATSPERLAEIIRTAGFKADLSKDSSGDPMIRSAADGTNFTIYFYGCKDNTACKSVQFSAGFSMDKNKRPAPADILTWNKKNRFGSGWLDDEGDPYVQMDMNLDGGVSRENFLDTHDWWMVILRQFRKDIVDK